MLHQRVRQTPERKKSSTTHISGSFLEHGPGDDDKNKLYKHRRSCFSVLALAIQSSYDIISNFPSCGLRFVCVNNYGRKLRGYLLSNRNRPYIRKRIIIIIFTMISFIFMINRYDSVRKQNIVNIHPKFFYGDSDSIGQLKINIFDPSKIDDLGGFLHPTKYRRFPSYQNMPIIEDDNINNTESGNSRKNYSPDYGGLDELKILSKGNFQRVVEEDENNTSLLFFTKDNGNEKSKKHSGDEKKKEGLPKQNLIDDDDSNLPKSCRRIAWQQSLFPNCNSIHEIDLMSKLYLDEFPYFELSAEPFSHGFYRDAWTVRSPINFTHIDDDESIVMKTFRLKNKFGKRAYENVRKDALIMERLTKSPRIVNIYGHCGLTVTVEELEKELEEIVVPKGFMKKEELNDIDDVKPQNQYTPTEKLNISLEMAKSLADLHGFEGGIIVHDDVQLCQWLYARNGMLKLGDFNRATVMFYNEESGKYCKFNNGKAYGDYRSPEEFARRDLDESIDVFSFGNNMYALLTGLWPFYDRDDDEVKQSKIITGELAYIDERYEKRSFAENKLIELIKKCWNYEPKDRWSIFQIVDFLTKAVHENQQILEGSKQQKT